MVCMRGTAYLGKGIKQHEPTGNLSCEYIFIAPSSPPENLNVTSVSSTSIRLSWTPPPAAVQNGIITEYRINVTEVDTGRLLFYTSFTTSFVVQGLHPYYMYECRVSAYTVAVGPLSDPEVIQTPEDSKEKLHTP